ncbi:hypothetical protein BDW67DRAFT_115858 [Aspergillus spinulosporus]
MLSVRFCPTLGGTDLGPCIYPCASLSSTVQNSSATKISPHYDRNGGQERWSWGNPENRKQRHGQIYFHKHGWRISRLSRRILCY